MERPTLEATKRQDLGSRAAHRLRQEGQLPAVLYGHQRDTVHLCVPDKRFHQAFHAGARMVDLEIGGTVETALLKDVQYDSMGDNILHVDFARVDLDERITVLVAVELHGLAKGATSGGTLDHVIQDVEVACRAGSIPETIRIEIADMDIGDIIHIRDLSPPEGVEFLQNPDAAVVTIHPPVAVAAAPVAEAGPEAEAGAEPEVIGGRREKEEDGADEAKQE